MITVFSEWGFYGCETGCEGYRIYRSAQASDSRELVGFEFVMAGDLPEVLADYAARNDATIDWYRCVIGGDELHELPKEIRALVVQD